LARDYRQQIVDESNAVELEQMQALEKKLVSKMEEAIDKEMTLTIRTKSESIRNAWRIIKAS
jgi:hypothetical protein